MILNDMLIIGIIKGDDLTLEKRPRLDELFYIRAIAALGIFIIHCTGNFAFVSPYKSNVMYVGILLNQFFRFGTPIFMTISGLVLFYNYRNPKEFNPMKFYKKKLVYVIIPYVVWSFIYFLNKSYTSNASVNLQSLLVFVNNLFTGKTILTYTL